MSTYNICFCGEIRKMILDTPYLELWLRLEENFINSGSICL